MYRDTDSQTWPVEVVGAVRAVPAKKETSMTTWVDSIVTFWVGNLNVKRDRIRRDVD